MYKIIFNPYSLQIAVKYRDEVTVSYFRENSEWLIVGYDKKYVNYLHIQVDYDNCLQLIVYPRQINKENDYNEDSVWYSNGEFKSRKIKIVSSDAEFEKELNKL